MKIAVDSSKTVNSCFEMEEYFPVKLVFDSSYENIRHIGFYHNDTDLVEFTVDRKTGGIKKVMLVMCSEYTVSSDRVVMPDFKAEGAISIEYDSKTNCNVFFATVYSDGVIISLSDWEADFFYKSGQMLIGVNNDNSLNSIYIVGLSETEVNHIKSELSDA